MSLPLITFCWCECVHPKNLVNTVISRKTMKEISPVSVADVVGFVDVSVRIWWSKVKLTEGGYLKSSQGLIYCYTWTAHFPANQV